MHSSINLMRKMLAKVKPPEMATIPAGGFIMGTSDDQIRSLVIREEDWALEWYEKSLFSTEQPQHDVALPTYELARFPVTNAEYHQFIWETGHRVPRGWIGFHFAESTAEHPVVGVSMKDALAYCQWLNNKFTKSNGGSDRPFRLPSEAEWEKASRGQDDRLYPWGDEFDPWRCNTVESGKRGTTARGEYSPGGDSAWGVIDMAGNVWEWTASLHQPYPYDPGDGREDVNTMGTYVIRGGAWYYSHKLSRCSAREGALPTFLSPALGFRLARSI
ncbi:MAG: formylglycine-generating enzyme family protein [Chloroflexi bacterium]|nr:formylglycine-generating enzyme family protein [Chloroflexota bacterium]